MRRRPVVPIVLAAMGCALLSAIGPARAAGPPDDTPVLLNAKGEHETGAEEAGFDKLRDAYYSSRLLAGDQPIGIDQASQLRESASKDVRGMLSSTVPGKARGGTWVSQGPNPIVQVMRTSNTFGAMSGRVGALAIRGDGTIILGAAQGGIWTYDATTKTWTSRTQDADTQSVGALGIAPSDDKIVYMGTGEGSLAGDSYWGDGVWRSADGGLTWTHVSSKFVGQATSAIAVDPTNPNHLYVATVRGRGGNHRTTAPVLVPFGVWESSDGGVTWALRKGTTDQIHGATDVVMDPQDPKTLWASFWGDAIYKTVDGGKTWATAMNGLPAGNFLEGGTRFALGVSHPAGSAAATVYAGFDWFDTTDVYHPGHVFKSADGGASWADASGKPTGIESVVDYCTTQCFYDNVVKPDPTNPDVVYALGSFGYTRTPAAGGVFRSTDGGKTWLNLGADLHPDYHAIAFQPGDSKHVAIGNDGGVWQSFTGGGRPAATDPLLSTDWEDLNGTVNPNTGALVHSTGLTIAQFVSIGAVPNVPGQYWGGTQDNGTLRKSLANGRWFDQSSGDGGNVIVDQTTPNPFTTTFPGYVFGTYFGISPFRFDPAHINSILGNETIDGGIDLTDRAEFYIPWTQNRANPNQLFLGTYRLYRTDNAEAPSGGDVTWSPISPDLTTGCAGAAPNGARGCLLSAVAVADGGDGVWTGSDDAVVSVSPDAVTSAHPTWTRVGANRFPNRPVDTIAVDKSNWRIAYIGFGGFGAATPTNRGHVFATTDGGKTFRNATGNLPDVPVNSVVIDPSDSNVIYVGTDVGTFVSVDAGREYKRLGNGMPKVATWQLDYDPKNGVLVAGTHGRGAYTLQNRRASSALVLSSADTGTPVGPGSTIDYSVTVKNIGNAASTGLAVAAPVPANTSFVSAGNGGVLRGRTVSWRGLSVPAGGEVTLTFSAKISPTLPASVHAIVLDGLVAQDAAGVRTTGSPHTTPIAPPHAVVVAPATQTGGAKVGSSVTYQLSVSNEGFLPDTFSAAAAGGSFTTSVLDATCTTPLTTTPSVAPGATVGLCVKVDVPSAAADETRDTSTVTVTSAADATVTGTSSVTTIAVAQDTLLVDEDGNGPDVSAIYKAAMGTHPFAYWDLATDPEIPQSYLNAHTKVVWWTGNSFPAPVTPYETELASFLDNGGRLMMSGQDILDQAAGTTAFVQDYLHIAWDGSEVQNDKPTATVTGVTGDPVTNGIGAVPIDHTVLGAAFEDQVTPIAPATGAFTDDTGQTDALTVASGAYKVLFLAFPVEAYGSATDKAGLVDKAFTWFDAP